MKDQIESQEKFSFRRFSFFIIALGAGFGLGNLWRFPYVVSENGGGAFMLIYVFLLFVVGLPLLIGELILGRQTKSANFMELFTKDSPNLSKRYRIWSFVLCLFISSYYAVISGWVLYYAIEYTGAFLTGIDLDPINTIETLKYNGWLQIGLTFTHIVLIFIIATHKIKNILEKFTLYIVPIFLIFILISVIQALSLDSFREGIKYFFYPDFSQLTLSSVLYAIGQVLFTLSAGCGALVLFGQRLPKNTYIPRISFTFSLMDLIICFFAGLIVFPLLAFESADIDGPDLIFEIVNIFLSHTKNGTYFGAIFYLCLYLAALGSTIPICTNLIKTAEYFYNPSGKPARNTPFKLPVPLLMASTCLLIASFPALSSTVFDRVTCYDQGVLRMFDMVIINWALPISALILSYLMSRKLGEVYKANEFIRTDNFESQRVLRHWNLSVKWLIPFIIISALVMAIIDWFV